MRRHPAEKPLHTTMKGLMVSCFLVRSRKKRVKDQSGSCRACLHDEKRSQYFLKTGEQVLCESDGCLLLFWGGGGGAQLLFHSCAVYFHCCVRLTNGARYSHFSRHLHGWKMQSSSGRPLDSHVTAMDFAGRRQKVTGTGRCRVSMSQGERQRLLTSDVPET